MSSENQFGGWVLVHRGDRIRTSVSALKASHWLMARRCRSSSPSNGNKAHGCARRVVSSSTDPQLGAAAWTSQADLQHPCVPSRDPEAKANRIAPQRCQDPLVASPSLRVKFMAAGALLFSSVPSMGYVLRNCGTSGLRTGQVGQNSANAGSLCS